MGLFSSSIKYYAYAASSALFDEDERPDTVKSLLLQTAISNDGGSMAEAITLALQTNMYARARSMIRYATKEGGYVRGLPETSHTSLYVNNADIIAQIESEIGEPIKLHSVGWGQPNNAWFLERAIAESYMLPSHFPWDDGDPLDTTYNYNDDTIEIPVTNPDTLAYYESNNQYTYNDTGTSFQVTFPYTDKDGAAQTWAVTDTYDLAAYQEGDWVMVRYITLANPSEYKYWIYLVDSGVSPWFEARIDKSSLQWQYLPVAVLMKDKVWYDEEDPADDDDLQVTTEKLLKRLTMKASEVKEEYLAQKAEDDAANDEEKSNAEEWDFFIQFAVPIHSTIRGSKEYCYHFLQFLESKATWTTFDDYQDFLAGGGASGQPTSNFHIEEGGTNSFHAFYRWSYIHSVTREGQYTPDGWSEPLYPRRMHSEIYEYGRADYSIGLKEVHGPDVPIFTGIETEGTDHNYAVFTRQHKDVATGAYSYTQVLMMAPNMMYVINTEDQHGSSEKWVPAELFPEDPTEESEFRFPVHIGSLKATSTMHREEMLSDALCATVFLVERVKVKWYQKTFFKWLIVIIVIILMVLSYQYQWLAAVKGLALAATGATALGLWALYTVMVFAFGFLISFAGALIGGTAGKLFVIVGMIMMRGQNPFSNLAGSWAKMSAGMGFGTAVNFLGAVQPFLNFAMVIYQDLATADLEAEMRDFLKSAREKQDELDDAWAQLGDAPSWLDPMDLIKVQSTTYIESSSDFIERSLDANPGLLGYDLISNFSEIALMLPESAGGNNIVDGMMRDFAEQRGAV